MRPGTLSRIAIAILGVMLVGRAVAQDMDCSIEDCSSGKSAAEGASAGAAFRATLPDCPAWRNGTTWTDRSDTIEQETFFTPRWIYWQGFVNDMYGRFKLSYRWQGAWTGDITDHRRPMHRLLSGLTVLAFGTTDTPGCPGYVNADTAYCWAGNVINQGLVPACQSSNYPDANAQMFAWHDDIWHGFARYTQVWVYPGFFDLPAIDRAGMIVHEARHAEGCTHNAGVKDQSYLSGCQEYTAPGAYAYELYYLADYARRSVERSYWSTPSIRKRAVDSANQAMAFMVKSPCWEVGADGNYYWSTNPLVWQSGCGDI